MANSRTRGMYCRELVSVRVFCAFTILSITVVGELTQSFDYNASEITCTIAWYGWRPCSDS